MVSYTGEERAFCIQAFYENNRSYVSVRRRFRLEFGLRNIRECPSTNLIKQWLVRFKRTGSTLKSRRKGRARSVRTTENIERVRGESVCESGCKKFNA
ncbi:uncharacterized protein LOC125224607 [Leguminivora glycinivorella]|uniref:uncharacterized protein LOC125224607 n=1 Tax=Leguminivora glycinivorella TaxID=1035111 RepID=UPI00200C2103|nr:uncharacterized protein LOC125224607 [Leguminivora glycinivorella]